MSSRAWTARYARRYAPAAVTFSIVAAEPGAGEAGVAVASKFLAAAAVVSWARGGIGAVATQVLADVSFGPWGLDLLGVDRLVPDFLRHQ